MKAYTRLVPSALLLVLAASPALAQEKFDRSYQWYWGAQAGALAYKTNTEGPFFDPTVGLQWVITHKRTALLVSGEQAFFATDAHAQVADPGSGSGVRDVTFNQVRRLAFGVLVYPMGGHIDPYAGAGFALFNVLNPTVDCSGTTANSSCPTLNDQLQAQDAASNAASWASGWLTVGLQLNFGPLAVFGDYALNSAAKNVLLDGVTHTIHGGVRYTFGSGREDITGRH
jgi:hypothetical protein